MAISRKGALGLVYVRGARRGAEKEGLVVSNAWTLDILWEMKSKGTSCRKERTNKCWL